MTNSQLINFLNEVWFVLHLLRQQKLLYLRIQNVCYV